MRARNIRQRLRRYNRSDFIDPGLLQPWAAISERLWRKRARLAGK